MNRFHSMKDRNPHGGTREPQESERMNPLPVTKDFAAAIEPLGRKIESRTLWLDKLPPWKSDDKGKVDKKQFLQDAFQKQTGEDADPFLKRNKAFLKQLEEKHAARGSIRVLHAKLMGRLAINLADGIIENAGICLDRLSGQPRIPGSAVKGAARHAAWTEWKESGEGEATRRILERVFGPDAGSAGKGAVCFLPAIAENEARLVVDVATVHHRKYYSGKMDAAKDDENPVPNFFPAVEEGAEFAFPIVLNGLDDDPALLDAAARWLRIALEENGIGAKTAAGYGWFSNNDAAKEKEAADAAKAEAERSARRDAEPDPAIMEAIEAKKNGQNQKFLELCGRFKHSSNFPKEGDAASPNFQRSLLEVLRKMEAAGETLVKN